jgi:hypothetical protein
VKLRYQKKGQDAVHSTSTVAEVFQTPLTQSLMDKKLADIHEDTELKLLFRQDRASEQSLGEKQVYI